MWVLKHAETVWSVSEFVQQNIVGVPIPTGCLRYCVFEFEFTLQCITANHNNVRII